MNFKELCEQLEAAIESSYTEGVSLEQAEKLAGRFLGAQLAVSAELKKADLDSRMRKSGLKAVRAVVYLEARKENPKPTEAALSAIVDTHEVVQSEQSALDTAEVERDDLERYYDIFTNGHIFFRGVAKGAFGG